MEVTMAEVDIVEGQIEWFAVEGRVKWFNDAKGYGYISVEGRGDIFVHYTAIMSDGFWTLDEGQAVRFDVQNGPKGLFAQQVVKLADGGSR